MKCLVIYKSIHHDNTVKVARAIAEQLDADLSSPEHLKTSSINDYDLIGIGSGIYFGKHHRTLFDLVERMECMRGTKVFIFYTSGFRGFPARPAFHEALLDALEKKGATMVGLFSCRGVETYGPFRIGGGKNKGHPTSEDLEDARVFAKGLLTSA